MCSQVNSGRLFNLAKTPSCAGDENLIALLIKKELEAIADEVYIDPLGNVIASLDGSGEHILLDAHVDQIGLIVRSVDDSGFLRVDKCGSVDLRTMCAQEVSVWGKEELYGVVTSTPPHLTGKNDESSVPTIDNIYIDIALDAQKARELVSPGDRITLRSKQYELLNGRVSSPALDNRAGVECIIRCFEMLKENRADKKVSALFSVQEEVGCRGAATGAFQLQSDRAICVDVSFSDAPGIDEAQCGKMSGGPMIGFSPILDHEMSKELENTAKEIGISYQTEVMGRNTATNADSISISGRGIKTALVSIPIRNMHTGIEVADTADIENAARLIAAYIKGY